MKLRDYLLSLNITQGAFAKIIGINREYLNCIIKGKKKPGKHLAMAISAATNGIVEAEGLINGRGAHRGETKRSGRVAGLSGKAIDTLQGVIEAEKDLKKR